jgi:DNA-binding IclR family transcriptional regulator
MSKIVERTLDCFELFADQKRPLSLTEVSRLLGIPPSSCHDVLQALQERGYIYELAPRGGFYPTLRMMEISRTIAEHDPVLLRAEILMRSLRDVLDESVNLAKVTGLQARYLLTFEPSHPLRIMVNVGDSLRSVPSTSAGKAILASLDERSLEAYMKSVVIAPLTPKTVLAKDRIRQQIDEGRARGWFVNEGESLEGVTTVSSAFSWNNSLYIITVAGPAPRMEAKLEWAAKMLVDLCRRIEMRPSSGPPEGEA